MGKDGAHVIKADIMRMITMDARTDTRELLVQYLLAEEGTVQLTPVQLKQLERVEEADRLIRGGRFPRQEDRETILARKYNISRSTARNDLATAEYIFGRSRKRDKNYLMSNHIDFLDQCIKKAQRAGDMRSMVMLIAEKTKAIKELPDYTSANTAPAAIIFNIYSSDINDLTDVEMNADVARKNAMEYLKDRDITDIETEETE